MTTNEQPSILTVCVPGTTVDGTSQGPSQTMSVHEHSNTCPRAAGNTTRSGDSTRSRAIGSTTDSTAQNVGCDACDDSACGIDLVGDATAQTARTGSNLSNLQHAEDRLCDRDELQAADREESTDGLAACACRPSFFHADSGKKALELLRMLRFDLLVTGDQLPDMPVGQFIRRVRVAWPWQKWAMVGAALSTEDEIAARTLGAMAVFDAPADWEVLGSLAAAAAGKAATISNLSRPSLEIATAHASPHASPHGSAQVGTLAGTHGGTHVGSRESASLETSGYGAIGFVKSSTAERASAGTSPADRALDRTPDRLVARKAVGTKRNQST